MTLDLDKPVRVAAVQMRGEVGNVPSNLFQAEDLASQAFEQGAKIVALPEFFTTPVVFDEKLVFCALPEQNAALELLRSLASHYEGYIGGSALVKRGKDVYNTYYFAQPDGRVFTHDKDLPTMWENAFYTGGDDDGVFDTDIGGIGAAVCWEMIRSQTVERLQGKIGLAMTGSNWWSIPENWMLTRSMSRAKIRNRKLADAAPVVLARRLGVPVLHAAQAGHFEGRYLLLPSRRASVRYSSNFVGRTAIIDADGTVLANRRIDEGPGFVLADVYLGAGEPAEKTDYARFWIPKIDAMALAMWRHQRLCGRWFYKRRRPRLERDPRKRPHNRRAVRDRGA